MNRIQKDDNNSKEENTGGRESEPNKTTATVSSSIAAGTYARVYKNGDGQVSKRIFAESWEGFSHAQLREVSFYLMLDRNRLDSGFLPAKVQRIIDKDQLKSHEVYLA